MTKNKVVRKLNITKDDSPALAYILGVLVGDGTVHKNRIQLKVKSKVFVEAFSRALSEIGLKPKVYLIKDRGDIYYSCRAHSIEFVEWFKSLSLDSIRAIATKYPLDFIRGFYESEGCIYKDKYVGMTNTDGTILSLVKSLLENLGFHPKLYLKDKKRGKPCYDLRVYGKREIQMFIELIKPHIKNTMTQTYGKRSSRTRHTLDIIRKALELRKQGLGYRKVAKILKISPWTVKTWFSGKIPKGVDLNV